MYYSQEPQVIYEERNPNYDRSRHVEANCNMGWTNCANVCNTVADPNQRALCILNCNNARNQCVKKG